MARLDLDNFRSYRGLRLELEPLPVVLVGANGAGKTNLLEALSLLAPGRGLRRARLAELARREPGAEGGGPWAVAARIATPDGAFALGTGQEPADPIAERRAVHVDGVPRRGQAALAERLSLVWLVPEMDRLFQDGASARRRFLDRLAAGFDAGHAGRVAAYDHALAERSRLLRAGAADAAWLAALEQRMAEDGVALAATRRETAARLARTGAQIAAPFPTLRLALAGEFESWLASEPALAVEERLMRALAESRARDGLSGGAAHGPHRSDLRVAHGDHGRPAEDCSTGEQKALLIALILAYAAAQAAARGRPSLLLFDEAAAHLDEARRQALFRALAAHRGQVWLTGTTARDFAALEGRAQFLAVGQGTATRRGGTWA